MNKKQLLLLLTLIFGVQQIKPAASWSEKWFENFKEFVSGTDTRAIVSIGIVAAVAGTIYKFINEEAEAADQDKDNRLIQSTESELNLVCSKYKDELQITDQAKIRCEPYYINDELQICSQQKMWYELYPIEAAAIVNELACFFIEKPKYLRSNVDYSGYEDRERSILAFEYGRYLNETGFLIGPSMYRLKDRIARLKDRRDRRYKQLEKNGKLETVDTLIDNATKTVNKLELIYNLMRDELGFDYLVLAKMHANKILDFHDYLDIYNMYKADEYINRLQGLISKSNVDIAKKISKAIKGLEGAIDAMKEHFIKVEQHNAMITLSYRMCAQAEEVLQALQHTHSAMATISEYHKELEQRQKLEEEHSLEQKQKQEQEKAQEQTLVEQMLANQRKLIFSNRAMN